MNLSRRHHTPLRATALVALLMLLVSWLLPAPHIAWAAVDLTYFELVPGPGDGQITVRWGTETETDIVAFRIMRSEANDYAGAEPAGQVPRKGSAVSGADYEVVDAELNPGTLYYYWLVEIDPLGNESVLQSANMAAQGGTPATTPTASPTASPTRTPTTQATAVPPTATPTATSRPTNTPAQPTNTPVRPTNTPTVVANVQTQPTNTPIVPTNTPTAVSPTATAPPPAATTAAQPTDALLPPAPAQELTQPTDTPVFVGPTVTEPPVVAAPQDEAQALEASPADTPTPAVIAQAPTATPETNLEREARPTATPRPTDEAGSSSSASSLLLVIGGGSLCGAGLLALVALFVWRRR